jgi:hypothetical protein
VSSLRKLSKFAYVLVVLLVALRVMADDDLQRMRDLFAPNVRIVSIERHLPVLETLPYNNASRILKANGKEFTYPDQIDEINYDRLDDSRMILNVTEKLPNGVRYWVWTFDLDTENWSRFNDLCGNRRNLFLGNESYLWVFTTGEDSMVRLCEMATGIKTEPLPTNVQWDVYPPFSSGPLPVFVSPDQEWLVLFGLKEEQTEIYSYHVNSQTLTRISTIACVGCFEMDAVDWYDDFVTIESYDYRTNTHILYSFTISQPSTFQQVITRSRYQLEFYKDPLRYEYINFPIEEDIWKTQCERVVYDILANQVQKTPLGPFCRAELGDAKGIGYYRDVSQAGNGIVQLVRYDAKTQVRKSLYTGEIEWVEWISPDEKYAILVLDSDGYISSPPFHSPSYGWGFPDQPRLAFVNIDEDKILFETPVDWLACDVAYGGPDFSWYSGWSPGSNDPCAATGPQITMFPRDNNEYLIIAAANRDIVGSYIDVAVVLAPEKNPVLQTPLLQGYFIPFNENYLFEFADDYTTSTTTHQMRSVDGQTIIPITKALAWSSYDAFTIKSINALSNQIEFSIVLPSEEDEGKQVAAIVTVEIPLP